MKVGDKVYVNWPGWDGEGVIRKIVDEGSYEHTYTVYIVRMETGNYEGIEGGFKKKHLSLIGDYLPSQPSEPTAKELADKYRQACKEREESFLKLAKLGYRIKYPDGKLVFVKSTEEVI